MGEGRRRLGRSAIARCAGVCATPCGRGCACGWEVGTSPTWQRSSVRQSSSQSPAGWAERRSGNALRRGRACKEVGVAAAKETPQGDETAKGAVDTAECGAENTRKQKIADAPRGTRRPGRARWQPSRAFRPPPSRPGCASGPPRLPRRHPGVGVGGAGRRRSGVRARRERRGQQERTEAESDKRGGQGRRDGRVVGGGRLRGGCRGLGSRCRKFSAVGVGRHLTASLLRLEGAQAKLRPRPKRLRAEGRTQSEAAGSRAAQPKGPFLCAFRDQALRKPCGLGPGGARLGASS